MRRIQVNCDMGEGYGPFKIGPDEELMPLVDQANIACGGHAGDPVIMRKTVMMAKKHNKQVGAHPGYNDILGFGRRIIPMNDNEIYCMILAQVGSLKAILDAESVPLKHIKMHGALYRATRDDRQTCLPAWRACKTFGVPVMGVPGSFHESVADELGIAFIPEAFVDSMFTDAAEGKTSFNRQIPALAPNDVLHKVRFMAMQDAVVTLSGETVRMNLRGRPFTICVHSDLPDILHNLNALRRAVDIINETL